MFAFGTFNRRLERHFAEPACGSQVQKFLDPAEPSAQPLHTANLFIAAKRSAAFCVAGTASTLTERGD